MVQVKRIGHATLTTPDLERQLDYYTRVVGLSTVAEEKSRAILATKAGARDDRAGARLPGGRRAARLSVRTRK
jgi:catechol 2,3-dioxygenase-like lactoylglutathione lyase family enzyme